MRFADELITQAISLNWERLNEQWARQLRYATSDADFLQEFATVRVNIGRMGGYTTYIKQHALPFDLILVDKQEWTKEFHQGHVYTHRQLTQYKSVRGRTLDKVWVDNASMVLNTAEKVFEFYQEISVFKPSQIIMLG